MSAAAQTRIFGVRIGVDPKILVGGLIVAAALLFWYNSRSDDEQNAPAAAAVHPQAVETDVPAPRSRVTPGRREAASNERGKLRLRAIDPTRGDVDPTLRLDLLARLQALQPAPDTRNLFETGPAVAQNLPALPAHAPIIHPGALPAPGAIATAGTPGAPVLNIPLKYYGFVRPMGRGASNRGFFMDGDNVLVGSEGEVLDHKYLVVELTPNSARLEDVQLKQGQTLPVIPEAVVQ